MDTPLVLMDNPRIGRSVKRMAYEIVEHNMKNCPVLLFGINQRGYAVAQKLQEVLADISDQDVQAIQFLLEDTSDSPALDNWTDNDVEDAFLVVVDDVIFSGQTMFKALKKITTALKPSEIHTAVMIDRGHRKFPVRAEFYGMELPTKVNEHVSVIVDDMEVQKVVLERD